MRKQTRRRKTCHLKMSHIGPLCLGALAFIPWLVAIYIDLSAEQVSTQVKQLEYEKRSLEASLRRQTSDWNHLIEPKRLDEAVRQNGMKLAYASPERSVIVRKDGRLEIPASLHAALQQSRIAKAESAPKTQRVASTPTTQPRSTRRTRR